MDRGRAFSEHKIQRQIRNKFHSKKTNFNFLIQFSAFFEGAIIL